jgi:hypothetical protein
MICAGFEVIGSAPVGNEAYLSGKLPLLER